MAEANKSYAVVGNNGIQTATLIPDLTQAIDSTFLKAEQNAEKLNCWQPIFTSNLISESLRQDEFPVSASGNFASNTDYVISWDFYLKGWTQMKHVILQYQLALNLIEEPGDLHGVFQGMAVPSTQDQSEYTWLDVLDKLDIKIGNNNFMLTNQEMHNHYGMKHLALCTTKSPAEGAIMANFGLNSARTSARMFPPRAWSSLEQPFLNIPNRFTNSDLWGYKSIDENARYYDHAFCAVSKYPNRLLIEENYCTKIFALPLSMVNSFFAQQDTWLPKGTRIQIQITFNNKRAYYTGNGVAKLSRPLPPTVLDTRSTAMRIASEAKGSLNGIFPQQTRIVYEYSNLRYEIQDTIKKLWIERPFLYNYYEWDVYKLNLVEFQGSPYIVDFKQNSQRPLDIWLSVRNIKNIDGFVDSFNPVATDVNHDRTRFQFKSFGLMPIIYRGVKVFINGREIINFEADKTQLNGGNIGDGLTPDDVINALIFEKCDQEKGADACRPLSRAFNFDNIYPFQITLAPNNFFQRGSYPVDQGAVNVRLELDLCFLDPTSARLYSQGVPYPESTLFVHSRRPAQLTFDSSHEVTQISWPLVVSNNTTIANSSINTN